MSKQTQNIISIQSLLSTSHYHSRLRQYNAGLKAMLDLMPEDTELYEVETMDAYLWVIDVLMAVIQQLLAEQDLKQQRSQ